MGEKIIPKVIYAAAGIFGVLSLYGLVTAGSIAMNLSTASSVILAVGGISWGLLKFMNFNLVEKLGVI